jgi:AcrR family transcriptional regulator
VKKRPARPKAQQDRSTVTHDLLCDAAEDFLREGGLAACTIQEVAARSGRSAGSVYRRFGDKEAMIEAVIERYLARALETNMSNLAAWKKKYPDLASRLKELVDGAIAGQRRNGRLIEAFREAAATASSATLPAAVDRTRKAAFDLLKQMLRDCSGEIMRPNKEGAIEFAVAMLGAALESRMRPRPLPMSDAVLRSELTGMLLTYLTTSERAQK